MMHGGADSGTADYIAVRCRSCEGRFRARTWSEDMACPACRATEMEPMAPPGGAIDYLLADRTQGTTRADVSFGEWARWSGAITANQYNTAVHRQTSELQERGVATPIHELLVAMKALDEEQALGILRFMTLARPEADDEDFVKRLLAQGEADTAKVAACQKQQAELAGQRNEVPHIGQLLLHRRVIDEAALLGILHEQDRAGRGALHVIRMVSTAPPKDTIAAKLARQAAESPRFIRNTIVVSVLLLVAVLVWAWAMREPAATAFGRCETCQYQQEMPWDPLDWPATCRRCKSKTVRYLVVCPERHVYTWPSPLTPAPCPRCGSIRGRALTREEFEGRTHLTAEP